MPTYQYQCTECGELLEIQQSFTDDALTECPVCEGRLRKVFNAVGVVFKGSGFYVNDSRSKKTTASTDTESSKPAKADKADKADKAAATTSSDSSSTAKPAPAKKTGTDSAA